MADGLMSSPAGHAMCPLGVNMHTRPVHHYTCPVPETSRKSCGKCQSYSCEPPNLPHSPQGALSPRRCFPGNPKWPQWSSSGFQGTLAESPLPRPPGPLDLLPAPMAHTAPMQQPHPDPRPRQPRGGPVMLPSAHRPGLPRQLERVHGCLLPGGSLTHRLAQLPSAPRGKVPRPHRPRTPPTPRVSCVPQSRPCLASHGLHRSLPAQVAPLRKEPNPPTPAAS